MGAKRSLSPWISIASRVRCAIAAVLVTIGLALLAPGCARFHPQPLAPEQAASDFQSRSLADPGLRTFVEANSGAALPAWPLPAWDLSKLTLAAFYYSPELDVARAKWAVASAGKGTAAERPNPTLSVTPGYNSTTRIPSPWLVTPALDIPIETAGKRGYRIAHANHLSEAAKLRIASAAWEVRSRLRRHWVDLYMAGETRRLLAAQRTTEERVAALLEAQLKAGSVSAFEVAQARIALQRTDLALLDAERQCGEDKAQLAATVGISASALDSASLSFAALSQPPAELPTGDVHKQALLNRADVLAALADYAASESALQLEIARQYPDIHLNPGYEFDQGDNKWSLGLTVTLPVLNQNQGPIAEAEAKRKEAAAQFNALQARVLGELDRASAAYHAALAKATTAKELAASVEKQQQSARARLEAGDISRLELTTVDLELNQAAVARVTALGQAQQAFGDLENAMQSPAGAMDRRLWEASPRTAAAASEPRQH